MIRALTVLLLPVVLIAAELLVYAPEATSSLVVQRAFMADPAMAGQTILVMPRWRSFEEALAEHPRAWALVAAPILSESGWIPVLQGQRLGSPTFRYRIIAIDHAVGLEPRGTLGLVQECGRERIDDFVAAGFPGCTLPGRHRSVAKASDLLQLLGLEMVSGVMVTPTLATTAMASFPGRVRVLAESRRMRLPVLVVREPADCAPAMSLAALGSAALTSINLDALVPFTGDPQPWVSGD